ncbi:cupredoxin domain-containing protein [Candidatus Woesearchaeota archaeon]|nr:cupredoxin domain-containing protein [Candidatus Woesearchaeota archaeon]
MIFLICVSLFVAGCADAPVKDPVIESEFHASDNLTPLTLITLRAYQFGYEPDVLKAEYGDKIMLTVTSSDVNHGIAIPDFGVNQNVPAEESVEIVFIANRRGEFEFFNPVYSGKDWKQMKGKLIVR